MFPTFTRCIIQGFERTNHPHSHRVKLRAISKVLNFSFLHSNMILRSKGESFYKIDIVHYANNNTDNYYYLSSSPKYFEKIKGQ